MSCIPPGEPCDSDWTVAADGTFHVCSCLLGADGDLHLHLRRSGHLGAASRSPLGTFLFTRTSREQAARSTRRRARGRTRSGCSARSPVQRTTGSSSRATTRCASETPARHTHTLTPVRGLGESCPRLASLADLVGRRARPHARVGGGELRPYLFQHGVALYLNGHDHNARPPLCRASAVAARSAEIDLRLARD